MFYCEILLMTGVKSETQKSESNGEFPVIFANESEMPCGRKSGEKSETTLIVLILITSPIVSQLA
jgi:hypothetical protein